jgi:GTP-binding protein EngB required for normal cell division
MTEVADGISHQLPDSSPLDLREYEKVKFELADVVRMAAAKGSRSSDPQYVEFQDFFARLAEDRFNLVVAGRFSRGKSSLMNAILGIDRLPTGIVPLTSVITSVGYGSAERVYLDFQRGGLPFEIRMDELSEYVTERGNPGNVRGIRQARIELPAEILRRGFHFIDTPGLGSSIPENTRTAMSFLPEADALMLVSGYDSPLSEDELRVLETMASTTVRVFFVLNKLDTVAPAARLEVTEYTRKQLERIFGDSPPPIFSTSAVDGLAAKLNQNPEALVATGLPALEGALTRFLIESKSRQFLLRMVDRANGLVDTLLPDAETSTLKSRIAHLRHRIGRDAMNHPGAAGVSAVIPMPSTAISKVRRCEICERINGAFFEFLRHYQHALVTDSQELSRFVADGGFCARHFWLYASIAAPRDICVSLAPLLMSLAAGLRRRTGLAPSDSIAAAYPASQAAPACQLCAIQRDIESEVISQLAAGPLQQGAASRIEEGPAVCLPHLRTISERLGNRDLLISLFVDQSRAAERLAEDMRRYALKHDGLRRALTSDEERRAARDGISYVAGLRSIIP